MPEGGRESSSSRRQRREKRRRRNRKREKLFYNLSWLLGGLAVGLPMLAIVLSFIALTGRALAVVFDVALASG